RRLFCRTDARSIDPIFGRHDGRDSMNSLLDPFLYELVRTHEQELLEARGSAACSGLGLGRRVWRRTHASGRRRGGRMDKWLMVVIGWGIVGPILAIGVCYVVSWRRGNVSWRPGCRLSGSRHCLHLHHWRLLTKTDRRHGTSDAVKSLLPRHTWPMHL